MSRVARIVVPGFPHHITQRGNRQMDVFETDDDRLAYLRFLKKYALQYNLSIYAYCLMTNHIHLVVVPGDEVALGKALRDTHTVYAMYFNTRTAFSGMYGRDVFIPVPLTNNTCGNTGTVPSESKVRRDCPGIPLPLRSWWSERNSTAGQAQQPIAAFAGMICCR